MEKYFNLGLKISHRKVPKICSIKIKKQFARQGIVNEGQ
jgi:hypothetical protein